MIPIFFGFHYKFLLRNNLRNKLARYYFLFILTGWFINVFFYLVRSDLVLRDYWIVFFPISQNYFVYATSCILVILLFSLIYKKIDKTDDKIIRMIFVLITILFVILPTIFSKDLWGFQEGNGLSWISYLFFVGYLINRFNFFEKRKIVFHFLFSLFLFLGIIVFMADLCFAMRGHVETANRFSVPYSLFAMYFSFSMFMFLEKAIQEKISIKLKSNTAALLLIVVQVIVNWPLAISNVETYYKKSFSNSGLRWFQNIIIFLMLYVFSALIITFILKIIQMTPFLNKLDNKFSFASLSDTHEILQKYKKKIFLSRRTTFSLLIFYAITFLQFIVLSEPSSLFELKTNILRIISLRQAPMVLTVVILMLFTYLLILFTNKFWYSFFFTLGMDLLLTVATVLKIKLREEPILPSDLKMLAGISEMFSMVSPMIITFALVSLLILIVSSLYLQKNLNSRYHFKISFKRRMLRVVLIMFFFSSFFWINHKNTPSYLLFNLFKVNKSFFNQGETIKENGPIVQFIINIDVKIMEKPNDYTKQRIVNIMKKYDRESERINLERNKWDENQTIIFNLSESFSDPSRVSNLKVLSDPIPYTRSLLESTKSGEMLSVGYGGGTANVEWETLSGLDISNLSETLITPYTQLVEKQGKSPNFTNLFDEKIAIHPYTATLYNRKKVFEKFGFQKFYYEGSPNKLSFTEKIENNPRISDESAYKETIQLVSKTLDRSQFVQLTTMQNHMPYQNDYYAQNDFQFSGSAVVDSRKSELHTFMQGINYTDNALKKFIEELDKIQKPITLVFYGDHLPGIYSGNTMSKYGLNLHETDFFIYNNKYSNERNISSPKNVVSSYNFPSLALEYANLKLTPYYALLTNVSNKLPAATIDPFYSVSNRYNGKKIFVSDKNKIIQFDELSKDQKEILRDYQLIQYDLVAGEQYSANWATRQVMSK